MTRYHDYYIGMTYQPSSGWCYIISDEAGDIIQRSTVFPDKSIALRAACLWIDAVLIEGAGLPLPKWTDAKSTPLDAEWGFDDEWGCRIYTRRDQAPQPGDIVRTNNTKILRVLEILEIKPNGKGRLAHLCRTELYTEPNTEPNTEANQEQKS